MQTSPGYVLQGKYAEAQPLFERALALNEDSLGVDHESTIATGAQMGDLYKKQGFFSKAFPLLKEVVHTHERVHGPDHPLVADALINWASLLSMQVRAW